MATFILPVGDNPDQTTRFTLTDVDYDFRIRYLQRLTNEASGQNIKADEWVLEISRAGQPPFMQTSLKTNRDLLAIHRYKLDCPPGGLVLRDTAADAAQFVGEAYSPERVTYEDLGSRFVLVYID